MAQHAILSASGSHRWLHCTPSALLEKDVPDSGSDYAREGSLAHAYCAKALKEKPEGYTEPERPARAPRGDRNGHSDGARLERGPRPERRGPRPEKH